MDSGKWTAFGAIGTWVAVVIGLITLYVMQHPAAAAPTFPWETVVFGVTLVGVAGMQLRAAQINRQAAKMRLAAPPTPAPLIEEQALTIEIPKTIKRVYLRETPHELTRPFDELTAYQAAKLTEAFVEKWVRWQLEVTNVLQRGPAEIVTVTGWWGEDRHSITVVMDFDPADQSSVTHLSRGATVTVEGQITSLETASVFLNHCRIVG
jgi:hypothetical protein